MITLGSLFDGIGGWLIAAKRAGVKPLWSSEIEKVPLKVTETHFPDVEQVGDITNLTGYNLEPVDIITLGSLCFVEGTLITTKEGQVPIEDIRVGDLVMTHKNSFNKVVRIGETPDSSLMSLKITGSPETVVTPNHPYYVRRMERTYKGRVGRRVFSAPMWVQAKDLDTDCFVGFPINQSKENIKELSSEECYLLGRYIADGYINNAKRKDRKNTFNHRVIFCIGRHKRNEFLGKIKEHHISFCDEKSISRCWINNERLMDLCKECGEGALNKTVPGFILDLPLSLLEHFLEGYMSGDGCFTKGVYEATTISHQLAIGIQQVVHKVYQTPCKIYFLKRPKKHVIEGRAVNQHDIWQISFVKDVRRQQKGVWIDNMMWLPVKGKKFLQGKGKVYNLEVFKDHSYVANGCVVHNCQGLSLAGFRKGLKDNRSGLFLEAIRVIREMRGKTNGEYPKYAVWENVTGAFSSNKRMDFRAVIESFAAASIPIPRLNWAKSGMVRSESGTYGWRTLDAQYWGVPQHRQRIFLVNHFGTGGGALTKYFLSPRACRGILTRAKKNNRQLPMDLIEILKRQALS